VTIAENDTRNLSGIFPTEHACLFGWLLACSFQRLWYAALMGRRRRRVVDPRSWITSEENI
jgi:hypothetical protein